MRLRFALGSVVVVLVAGLTACSGGSASESQPHRATTTVPPSTAPVTTTITTLAYAPAVTHPEAFRGFGKLAYVSGGQLRVLDGTGAAPRAVGTGVEVAKAAWSHDGRWLAYQEQAPNGDGRVFVLPAAGGTPTQLSDQPLQWQWSPTVDVLAVVSQAVGTKTFSGQVELFRPDSPGRPVAEASPSYLPAYALSWSPDGRTLAFSVYRPGQPAIDHLFAVTIGCAGTCAAGLREIPVDVPAGNADNGLVFAGWTADSRRVQVWIDDFHSGSTMLDGLVVASVDTRGGRAAVLTSTLAKPSWVAPVAGTGDVILDTGNGRDWDQARVLTKCRASTGACAPLVVGNGPVIDPTVSGDGTRLGYVATDPIPWAVTGTPDPSQFPPQSSIRWNRSRRLVVAAVDGTGARTVSTGGVIAPRWANDGRHLVFARAGYLWLVDAATGAETAIAGPIDALNAYGSLPPNPLPFEENAYLVPGNDVWDQTAWLPSP